MADKIFGWDLIYKASEKDLKRHEDVIMLLIHVTLLKSGYRCVGSGDNMNVSGAKTSSELLPNNWSSSGTYGLKYIRGNEQYSLHGVHIDDSMVFNFLKGDQQQCSNVAFKVEDVVKALNGSLEQMVPKSEEVVKRIKTELIDPHDTPVSKEAETQSKKSSGPGNIKVPPCYFSPAQRSKPEVKSITDPERDPRLVGRQDLDPFGRGGGMIFNPANPRGSLPSNPGAGIPGGLPQGSVPPGARFDPFAPPGSGQTPRPRPPPDT